MNNQRKDLKTSINKAMNTTFENQEKSYTPEQVPEPQNEKPLTADRAKKRTGFDKLLKATGIVLLAASLLVLIWSDNSPTVDTSDAAKQAIVQQMSTTLPVGTLLMSQDENMGAMDYTITHSSASDEAKIWIWDYAAEDGDYVQLLVDGNPMGDAFMIKNKPREFTVPTTGLVQIKGIRDGGGGITYAVRYEVNNANYYNSAPEGEFNTYTLVRE